MLIRLMYSFAATTSFLTATVLACPPESGKESEQTIALSAMPGEPAASQRVIDLALCLDTSGSMSGLIEAAKIKLWDIVNELGKATPTPRLRVALLTFGNDGHHPENGWVRVDAPLTEDLDLISEKLFALTTNGGTELVGRVLKTASDQLEWTASDDALKIIVVAGNESADQDRQFRFRDVCRATIAKGVMINSIYCGNYADGIAPEWQEIAKLADGHFASIDHNRGTIIISTPYDEELVALSAAINETYIPYGASGTEYAMNQAMQDANAANLSPAVAAQRCSTKGGSLYNNMHWDLVDACYRANVKIEELKSEELPENMQAMTPEQRRAYVEEMAKKRAEIQSRIADLTARREKYVEQETKKQAGEEERSFDVAIRKAVRAQAMSKGFRFDDC